MITIVRLPDGHFDYTYEAGMTVQTVIDKTGWEIKPAEEIRVNGTPINGNGLDTEVRDGDAIVIVKPIAGN